MPNLPDAIEPRPRIHLPTMSMARRRGGLAALVVSTGFLILGTPVVMAFAQWTLDETVLVLGVPTVLAATLGGLLLGPAAARSAGDRPRGAILGLAVVTTLLGDYLVGFMAGLVDGTLPGDPLSHVGTALAMAAFMWPFGLVIFGLIALPLTLLGAILWWELLATWAAPIAAPADGTVA
jgi:hypothetical protein